MFSQKDAANILQSKRLHQDVRGQIEKRAVKDLVARRDQRIALKYVVKHYFAIFQVVKFVPGHTEIGKDHQSNYQHRHIGNNAERTLIERHFNSLPGRAVKLEELRGNSCREG